MEAAIDPSRSRRLLPGPQRNSLGAQKRPYLLVSYRLAASTFSVRTRHALTRTVAKRAARVRSIIHSVPDARIGSGAPCYLYTLQWSVVVCARKKSA